MASPRIRRRGAGRGSLQITTTPLRGKALPSSRNATGVPAFAAHHPKPGARQMSDKTLDDLFYDGLKDIYYAERNIL